MPESLVHHGMIEALIYALISIAVLCLIVYLVFWVLSALGIALPTQVERIVWIIVALIAILILLRALLPLAGHGRLLGQNYFHAQIAGGFPGITRN